LCDALLQRWIEFKEKKKIVNKTKMELETSDWAYTGTEDHNIPIDLFGSKKHAGVPRGILSFTDASGNIVYKVHRQPPNPTSSSPPKDTKLLLDSNDIPLFSIHRHQVSLFLCLSVNHFGLKYDSFHYSL
jgi:hypothetical protein